jgi:hypothetical protein
MSRAAPRFRQADIARALRGARTAGIEVGAIDIMTDGTIRIVPARGQEHTPSSAYEQWRASRHARRDPN